MRALTVVGFLFAVVALWAVTQSPSSSFDSQPHDASLGQGDKGGRSVDEKRALAIAFVQQQMHEFSIPGLTLSVVYKNETVIAQGFGTKQVGKTDTPVTASTLFQIGSYTKTFTALGIAKLVDDGRVQWNDPVKQHLPWFQLADKYAEKYTTLGDLLAMNSVLGAFEGDEIWPFGVYASEKAAIQHLANYTTTRPLRAGFAYSNLNFEVLGQVIEHMTNQTWFNFIKSTYLDPLGMHETFGAPGDATGDLSSGHVACNHHEIGPFDLTKPTLATISPTFPYLAAGSILSSANDLSKLSHFLLHKGHGILRSPSVVETMTTGHVVHSDLVVVPLTAADMSGFTFHADGNVLAAGYGFDFAGDVMYGYDFFAKNGDTAAFVQRNGFVPSEGLGVVLAMNVRNVAIPGSATSFILDRMRSYVMGVFLDISQSQLEATYHQAIAHANAFQPDDTITCDAHFFGGQPWEVPGVTIPAYTKVKLVGTYISTKQPGYYGKATVTMQGDALMLQYGVVKKPLIATKDDTTFIWAVEVGAATMEVTVAGLNTTTPSLTFFDGNPFTRTNVTV
ncbi:Aste57867_3550 [Aphanomyces stellatus]|uniref:Aste57867_3550 protein n=1 Tax=Aphanomyces stellatus TaxID=120398 RepID=A0A485KFE7_9STRA|nr:hypothetical protein As57867_003539 [Aphanomyces stellatus]VFT80713.1 Aste57867_3550 [Aphanomyces stellatus]